MKFTKVMAIVALVSVALAGVSDAQNEKFKIKRAKPTLLYQMNGELVQPNLAPTEGSVYGWQYVWVIEDPLTGNDVARGLSFQGGFADSTMDGIEEVRGGDFADFVDPAFAQNNILTDERLEFEGVDPGTGRNILRLTVEWYTDATEIQWDTFDMDLQDPADLDMDGITGAGPDGIFGTADDVVEPDGIFDTGDGVLDAPMPMDPPSLVVFAIDNDMDGDPMNDVPSNTVSVSNLAGGFFGSPALTFDEPLTIAETGEILWFIEDFDGEFIDLDRNGMADEGADTDRDGDGVLDSIRVDPIIPWGTDALSGNITGTYGLFFAPDGLGATTNEFMSGEMARIGYEFVFLSSTKNEFGIDDVLCGDVNLDGEVNLLDVAPFVNLIVNDIFQIEGDINMDGEVNILDVDPFVDKLVGG